MDVKNIKINFLGDSITEGVGASTPEHRFVSIVGRMTGALVNNYGIGGTRLAHQKTKDCFDARGCFADRMKGMEDADVCVLFGGTNDYGHGNAPFGEFSDRTADTFCGACHEVISYLAEKYAGKPFFVITPLHRLNEGNKNMHGRTLEDYVDVIVRTARYWSVPVLDLYAEYGINPEIESVRARFMPDGLHPSDEGHRLLAEKIVSYIKNI